MKKLLYFLVLLSCSILHAQFVQFHDSSSKNKFLGFDLSVCKTKANKSSKNYQKGYDCGNGTISELLNVNFLTPSLLGQQFYLYNDFMYWIGKNIKAGNILNTSPDSHFSGAGVFMIILGTSPYLKQFVAPDVTCPTGQTLMMAQLKYNDGYSLTTWSQDAVCLAPTDQFSLQVSSEPDNTVSAQISARAGMQLDWMYDSAPKAAVYEQASSSPRKVRIIRQLDAASAEISNKVGNVVVDNTKK